MKTIRVNLGSRSYDIQIGDKILLNLGKLLKRLELGKDAFVITNPNIFKLHGVKLKHSIKQAKFSSKFEIVLDSERSKSIQMVLKLLNKIIEYDKKRTLFIIAFGGGVVGDLAGFIASIYKRGIPYIQVPTTLLSQIDSSIGGKVAVDLKVAKNLVGSFYQPRGVFSDLEILKTLPERQLRSGMAEAIKYGIIKQYSLFEYLEKNYERLFKLQKKELREVVYRCSIIKAKVVEEDERDIFNKRIVLNFGHTIGHAIEAASRYQLYTHGEAVALGMICACRISQKLGILSKGDFSHIEDLIKAVKLPTKIRNLKIHKIFQAYQYDKKFIGGKNRFILPMRIGKVLIKEEVPLKLIISVLKERLE